MDSDGAILLGGGGIRGRESGRLFEEVIFGPNTRWRRWCREGDGDGDCSSCRHLLYDETSIVHRYY